MLRIPGVWLEKAGLGISQKVEVTVGDGILIIQKDN
jgi:antitoxin component of MazEF toxin-antitoxin module